MGLKNFAAAEKIPPILTPSQSGTDMTEVMNIYDAKAHLSRLIDRATAGEDILIGRAGKPLVRLTPVEGLAPRSPGLLKGVVLPDALFDPLPDDEQGAWE